MEDRLRSTTLTQWILILMPVDDSVAEVDRERGKVIWFSDVRGYGFIEGKNKQELFVHFRDIRTGGYRTRIH